nr:hypothetical protein GCM10020093_065210 [Planobispora longispora]
MTGGDGVGQVPEGRWEAFDDGSPRTAEALARTTRHGGFLGDVAGFDADFFGIVPGEAETMDPQQRLLLETAWEALEHAGIAPRSLRGSRTGAFVGISGNEYAYLTTADASRVDAWTATGAAFSIAANRLSYVLDLRGPSLAVDTACSSSLVATDLAVRSLRAGDSDLALAAGVNLLLSPVVTMAFDQGGGRRPTGGARPSTPRPTGWSGPRAAASWCSNGWRTRAATGTGCWRSYAPRRSTRTAAPTGWSRPTRRRRKSCCAPPTPVWNRRTTSRPTAPGPSSATPSRPARSTRPCPRTTGCCSARPRATSATWRRPPGSPA